MDSFSLKTPILLLLSLLTGGSVALSLIISFGDTQVLFSLEKQADSDDFEDSSDSKLIATLHPGIGLLSHSCFHPVCDEVNHQTDWLLIHEHAARAPPSLG
jgi:hypothetical protein